MYVLFIILNHFLAAMSVQLVLMYYAADLKDFKREKFVKNCASEK